MAHNLTNVSGTICEVFTRRMNEINFNASIPQLKSQIIDILRSDEIKRTDTAEEYVAHIQSLNNRSALMSTVVTYVTCIRATRKKTR